MPPELIADYRCETGENPLWHPGEQRLYWVDIPAGRIFRYDPASGKHEQFYEGDVIGGFTIQADGALLLFMARGAIKIWRNGKLITVVEEIPDERETRFNDVIADPKGRVFCGTMPAPDHLGRLYRLDTDATLTRVVDGVEGSNGIGFTRDLRQMYYTDSDKHEIFLFDYDQSSGAITNQRIFVRTPADGSVPDGLTVDAEGYIWSARWDGGCLVRYRPDGTEERRIRFPAKKVSSLTFGGADYTDIYVTTAGGDNKGAEGEGAGALFRLRLGIQGVPEFPSRIRL
jgi:sugar lactone lactonase YvrE